MTLFFKLPIKYFIFGSAGSLLLASQTIFAYFSLDEWEYYKEIFVPETFNSSNLISIHPDVDIFSNSSEKLKDVRIIDNNGLEIPYILNVGVGEYQERLLHADFEHNRDVGGKYTSLTADLGSQESLHNRIEIDTPILDFNRLSVVETSNDHKNWSRVSEQKLYSIQFDDLGHADHQNGIDYPPTTSRYVRVRVSDEDDGPLQITGGQVLFVTSTSPQKKSNDIFKFLSSQNDNGKTTAIEIDIGSNGLPSHQVVLEISDNNFSRKVKVQVSEDSESWTTIQDASIIYSISVPNFTAHRLGISYKVQTSRYIRLIIDNRDNLALNIKGADVLSYERKFLFSANPENNYRIYYGNQLTDAPSYDIKHIRHHLNLGELPIVSIGPEFNNPHFDRKSLDTHNWLTPVVISVTTVSLGLLLLNMFRKASSRLKPPSDNN